MKKLLGHLFSWLVLTASAGFAPAALAACPPDCPFSYNYGITLTLDRNAELGGDIFANWDLETARLWGAPLTIAGYPVDLGVALVYRYKRYDEYDLVYEAYAGPFTLPA